MPTYEYACRACGEELEAVQSFSDAPLAECPKCGGELRKVFRSVGISFKGSGFYKNDSRSASSGAKSGASTSVSDSGETTPATASPETKPSEPATSTPTAATPAATPST